MKNVVSIGINNTNGLTPLHAAASGAEEFAGWAKSQGYTTALFTDLKNNNVVQNDIFTEINRIVEAKTCEQLIIFFSGHGILRSPNQEVWLLPNSKSNPNESINLTGSIDYARTTGIPYIVFISDACRILPTELQFTGNGSVIFPICDDTNEDSAIDVFYATRPGSPANEFNSKINSEKFGIFTQSLIEILNGQYTETIFGRIQPNGGFVPLSSYFSQSMKDQYQGQSIGDWMIRSTDIELPLKSIVREKVKKISNTLNQQPDIRIQYQNPKPYLSKFDDNTVKNLLLKTKEKAKTTEGFESDVSDSIQKNLKYGIKNRYLEPQSFKTILSGLVQFPDNLDMDNNFSLINNAEKIFESKGRESFETQTGFTIVGSKVADVVVNNNSRELFFENESQHIRIYNEDSISSALVVLTNKQSIPVAILKGYIGTLVFDENQLLTINYTPSENSYKYYNFKENEKEINFIRAYIASAANEGFDYQKIFQNEFDSNGYLRYDNPGSFLRREKSLDPSLGLYAAYAYIQAGKTKEVESVYRYMREESDNMLFDVAMLSGNLMAENDRLAPFCPMLSLGWAYRNRFERYLHPQIMEASNHLVPNLWTTFDANGTDLVIQLFKENNIK